MSVPLPVLGFLLLLATAILTCSFWVYAELIWRRKKELARELIACMKDKGRLEREVEELRRKLEELSG